MSNNAALNWFYLDLNSYFASVEQQLNPDFRNRPIAVVPVLSDYTCAIAASYEAKACGVKTGTAIHEARRLCPDLICVIGDHSVYAEYHHKILAEINKHIPIDIVASIDEVACRLTGSWQQEEKALEIAYAVKQGIADNIGKHIKCSIGIAENKFLAKVSTELEKPDGLVVLYNDELPGRLLGLMPGDLPGIGRSIKKRLHRTGVISMQDLWDMSAKNMRRTWNNVAGENFWYMLHGYQVEEKGVKKKTIGHSHVLGPDFRPVLKAKQVAVRLLLKAASRLRRMEYYTQDLCLTYKIEDSFKVKAQSNFAMAKDNTTLIKELEQLWDVLLLEYSPNRIKKISISFNNLIRENTDQLDLFADNKNVTDDSSDPIGQAVTKIKKQEKLSKIMDTLNTKFGRDTIVMGGAPREMAKFSSQKIAFTRIPDKDEFFD